MKPCWVVAEASDDRDPRKSLTDGRVGCQPGSARGRGHFLWHAAVRLWLLKARGLSQPWRDEYQRRWGLDGAGVCSVGGRSQDSEEAHKLTPVSGAAMVGLLPLPGTPTRGYVRG
jgi:hypothetical protein